jgi:hypothetical protein
VPIRGLVEEFVEEQIVFFPVLLPIALEAARIVHGPESPSSPAIVAPALSYRPPHDDEHLLEGHTSEQLEIWLLSRAGVWYREQQYRARGLLPPRRL